MEKLPVYLAGAIRDDHSEDIAWRELAIEALGDIATILNPMAGKTYDPVTKRWTIHGETPTGRCIVHHDFWCVNQAELILFNFLALAEKYPNIGTLGEFFYSVGLDKPILRYAIVAPSYTGHENTALYHLHPFLEEHCSMIFTGVEECLRFTRRHLEVLSGLNPHFGGVHAESR